MTLFNKRQLVLNAVFGGRPIVKISMEESCGQLCHYLCDKARRLFVSKF